MMTSKQIKIITFKLSFLLFLVTNSILLAPTYAKEVPLDKIAAVVNNDVVMLSEVLQTARRVKATGQTKLTDKELIRKI